MTYDQCLDFGGHSLTCRVYGFEFFFEVIERIQGVQFVKVGKGFCIERDNLHFCLKISSCKVKLNDVLVLN